jgi:Uma2 family endonuclease
VLIRLERAAVGETQMPTVVELPRMPEPALPRRKVWTRDEVLALEGTGILDHQHLELVQGDLIDKRPKTRPHSIGLKVLYQWLMQIFGAAFVEQEVPIDVGPNDNPTNEPEPDIIVLKREFSSFTSANPGPEDLRLAIEIAVEIAYSTIDFDLTTKAALYARAEIPEYWVLDVIGRRLLVHRDPRDGKYGSVVAFGEHESVAPLAAPQQAFRVRDAFPV